MRLLSGRPLHRAHPCARTSALLVLCKGRPVPKPRRLEPVPFTRAESIDLTHALQRCVTWQQLGRVYSR